MKYHMMVQQTNFFKTFISTDYCEDLHTIGPSLFQLSQKLEVILKLKLKKYYSKNYFWLQRG